MKTLKTLKHICPVTIQATKSSTLGTRWHVEQSRPYPHLSATYGMDWMNTEQLFPRGGATASLPKHYRCHLLRSDLDPNNATGDRNDFAGFSPGLVYDPETGRRAITETHPGTFSIRGRDMGEVSIEFGNNPEWPDIRLAISGTPSRAEREWIMERIVPQLRAYIATNAASLHREAVDALAFDTAAKLAKARAELESCEQQMQKALATLRQ
jgi:hypothetical protein